MSQGGSIPAFNVLPSFDLGHFTFGYLNHTGADPSQRSLVLVAPVVGGLLICLLAGLAIWRYGRPSRIWKSALILFWMLPLIDASMAVSGLDAPRRTSDLHRAFVGEELAVGAVALLVLALAAWGGWQVFVRTCGQVLVPSEYLVGFCFVVGSPWLTRVVLRD